MLGGEGHRQLQGLHHTLSSILEALTKGSLLGQIRHSGNKPTSGQILLLELRTLATSIASEASLLVQRDTNHSKKLASLEDHNEELLTSVKNLERELRNHKIKEKEYLLKLEQMEADLARLETISQSQIEEEVVSPELAAYLETSLQTQTSVAQIYRTLLEKVLQVVPAKMSSVVSDLAQNMIDQATLTVEEQALNIATPAKSLTDREWQENLVFKREAIENISRRQAELRSEMADLESQLEALVQTNKISQRVLLEHHQKNEDLAMSAMRLTRPKSSYLYQTQEDRRPRSPMQNFATSETVGESSAEFALLKSKLKEIKSKII